MRATSLSLLLVGALTALSAYAQEKSQPLTAEAAADGRHQGEAVLWGGLVVDRLADAEGSKTCLMVVTYPLRRADGKPDTNFEPRGWPFFACDPRFVSDDYAPGRLATVAGAIGPTQEHRFEPGKTADAAFWNKSRNHARRWEDGVRVADIPVVAVSDSRNWIAPLPRATDSNFSNPGFWQ